MKLSPAQFGVLSLCTGFALGAGGGWTWWQFRADSAPRPAETTLGASPGLPRADAAPPAPVLVLPPKLAPAEAEAALDAWLALGAPADGSAPAPLATQERALRALLTVLSDAQFPRLLETLHRRSGPTAENLRQNAIGIWLHRHPAAAAAWVLTADLPAEGQTRYHLARQIGSYWSDNDPAAALAWAETIPDPALATGVLEMILPNLAKADPARAIALAEARGPDFLAKVRDHLLYEWAQKDPAAALHRFGRELLDADPTSHQVTQALGHWLIRDTDAALAWLRAEGSGDENQRLNLLHNGLLRASEQPGQAGPLADALHRQTALPDKQRALSILLGYWLPKDPAAAQAWVTGLPAGAERTDLLEAIVPTNWHDHMENPEGMLPLALALPAGENRDARLALLVSTWAKDDPAAAAAWLEQQEKSDPSLAAAADRVEGGLVAALAAVDPVAARARYDALPPGAARRAAAPDIALAWADTDPASAARWLTQQLPPVSPSELGNLSHYTQYGMNVTVPGEQARAAQILGQASRAWLLREPEAALAWAESLPDPGQRLLAISSLSRFRSDSSDSSSSLPPEKHADLLGTLRDAKQRESTLSAYVAGWLSNDEEAARAWLETREVLSPETSAKLLSQAQRANN